MDWRVVFAVALSAYVVLRLGRMVVLVRALRSENEEARRRTAQRAFRLRIALLGAVLVLVWVAVAIGIAHGTG